MREPFKNLSKPFKDLNYQIPNGERECIKCGNFDCYYRRNGVSARIDCPKYIDPRRNIDVLKTVASIYGIISFLTAVQQESFCLGAKLTEFSDKRFPDGFDEWRDWFYSPYNGKDFEREEDDDA